MGIERSNGAGRPAKIRHCHGDGSKACGKMTAGWPTRAGLGEGDCENVRCASASASQGPKVWRPQEGMTSNHR